MERFNLLGSIDGHGFIIMKTKTVYCVRKPNSDSAFKVFQLERKFDNHQKFKAHEDS